MEYNKIKNAEEKINSSKYLIKNPENYKNKWHDLFQNHNPIYLELGTGRGDFLLNMARKYPNINFIGVEINSSQLVRATQILEMSNLKNIYLINMGFI